MTGASGGIGAACARALRGGGSPRGRPLPPRRGARPRGGRDLDGGADRPGGPDGRGSRSTGSSTRRAARSAGSTSAPRSPGSGPRRTCRSGSFRSSAGSETLTPEPHLGLPDGPRLSCARSSGTATARSSSSARRPASSARPGTRTTRRRSRPSLGGLLLQPEERDRADRAARTRERGRARAGPSRR